MIFRDDLRQIQSTAREFGARGPEDVPARFAESFQPAFDMVVSEEQSISQARHFAPFHEQRRDRLKEVAGEDFVRRYDQLFTRQDLTDVRRLRELMERGEVEVETEGDRIKDIRGNTPEGRWAARRQRQDIETITLFNALREQHPGILSDDQIEERIGQYAAALRQESEQVLARSQGFRGGAGVLAGAALAAVTDPLVLATLPLGAGPALGRGIAGNALRAFGIEAGIVAAIEVPLQAQVYDFKQKIDSPWTFKDAAFNVIAASIGAGAIRGTGSVLIDVAGGAGSEAAFQARRAAQIDGPAARQALDEYRAGVESGRIAATDQTEQAAQQLEAFAEVEASRRIEDAEAHHAAVAQAQRDMQAGRPTDVSDITGEQVQVPGGRPATSESLVVIDPENIGVDAAEFQFKARSDDQGVSERLRGVERFDQTLAGVAILYEDASEARWIVDGHQRLALARRAREAGQAAEETRLTAFILREQDGVTRSKARQVAAIKNIAEGTGSAIDAAKVLREVGEAGMNLLPPLPPNSALVRGARGLAKLEDEPFQAAINEVIPENYAAIIGERITGSAEQMATIRLLSQIEPANANQARMIVEQARATGFETRTTEDLFGTQEIAESYYKERAQVLDAAMKSIRRDRSTFQTVLERGSALEEAGNVLDQTANQSRAQADAELLGAISALANRGGPISDALNEAARKVRDGARPAGAATDFLRELRERGFRDTPARRAAGEPEPEPAVVRETDGRTVNMFESDTSNLDQIAGRTADLEEERLFPDEIEELQRILREEGEFMELPEEIVVEDGEMMVRGRPVREVFAELEATRRGLDDVELCAFPRSPS